MSCAALLAGCGGAMPLGHPAHVLNTGKTTLGAGVAGNILVEASPSATASATSVGHLQELALAPDVSPWVSARAGLGNGFEGGISASSRAIRLDGRRAFAGPKLALSIGLGMSAILPARPVGGGDPTGVYGGGFDVPILFGWRSTADLYAIYVGPRVGGELFSGMLPGETQGDAAADVDPISVSGRHLRFGGVAGLRAGFRRLYGVVEVEAAFHRADGTLGDQSLSLTGWTVAPSGALVVSF